MVCRIENFLTIEKDNTYIASFILFLFDIICEVCQTSIIRVDRPKSGLISIYELMSSEIVIQLVVDDSLK